MLFYHHSKNKWLYSAIPFISSLLLLIFFRIESGNWWSIFSAEQIHWGRTLGLPGVGVVYGIREFATKPTVTSKVLDLIALILGLGLVLRSLKVLRQEYLWYIGSGMIFYLTLNSLISLPRFIMILFPIFITMGQIKQKLFIVSYILICIMLTIFNIFSFVNGYWVS